MSSNKKYWKSVEELNPNQSSAVETLKHKEFVEEIPVDEFLGDKPTLESSETTRRDFLKYVGFSTAAASLAACEGPVIKSIPYVVQPEQIIPGVANYYATAISNGYDFASLLVKTREGRPIKVESNSLAKANGSINARVQASVLDLYDNQRVAGPTKGGEAITWDAFYNELGQKLEALKDTGKQVVLLTQTFASPSTSKLISDFQDSFANTAHVVYDAISESAAADAYQAKYGRRGLANYDFSKAKTIVSIGADFLGDWQGGVFDAAYAKGRVPQNGSMSRHIQFESNMTLSGANADKRVPLKPSQQKRALARLYGKLTGTSVNVTLPAGIESAVDAAAREVLKAGSNGVVLTGIQDVDAQSLVLEINAYLNSKAFDPKTTILTRQGNDATVAKLVTDMNAGKVGAVIMAGVNPAYTLPNATTFLEGLKKTDLSVVFSMKNDDHKWDNKHPTAQMLGRWQPWHAGHQKLFEEILKKTGQVNIMVRDVKGVDDNPFDFETVKKNIFEALKDYKNRIQVTLVPNITNICYGRGVGYKIEEIVLDEKTQQISATKIREQMRKDGKL